jgi:hypothetical protein
MLAGKVEGQFPVRDQRKLPPVDPMDRPDDIKPTHLLTHGIGQILDMDFADIDDPVGPLR